MASFLAEVLQNSSFYANFLTVRLTIHNCYYYKQIWLFKYYLKMATETFSLFINKTVY